MEASLSFDYCNKLVEDFEKVIKKPIKSKSKVYYTGVDLGTACVVIAVLDENFRPVAGIYEYADVVKDGMVVDYIGAVGIVRRMKADLEEKLDDELIFAAAAIPPGTNELDSGAIKNVVQAAGFELTNLLDEPTAANSVLKMSNGAVVDIGGGTTGISVLKDGKVIDVVDEPTGGTHFSLVLSGAYKMDFHSADEFKREKKNHKEIFPIVKPVIEKVAHIIRNNIKRHQVEEIALVGGTCLLTDLEKVIEKETGIPTYKPNNPMFVTPLGIALNCKQERMD